MNEKDFLYYETFLEDRLYLLRESAGRGPRRFCLFDRSPRKRPYKVSVVEAVPELGIKAEMNAFSYYGSDRDRIYILRNLVRFIWSLAIENSTDKREANWIFHVCLLFCCFHEFGHLYHGHCNLKDGNRMAMSYDESAESEINSKDIQAMEFEADRYAAFWLAAFVKESMVRDYDIVWGYVEKEPLYDGSIKAICLFFSIIKYLEVRVERKKLAGKRVVYDHPTYLLREILVGSCFLSLMEQKKEKRKDREFMYYVLNTDSIFFKEDMDKESFQRQYAAILDGSIEGHIHHIIYYCNEVLSEKTKDYCRIHMGFGKTRIVLPNVTDYGNQR